MGDELSLLLEIFNKIEKAGGQATLCVATGGGKTKVKLEITTTPAPPTGSTPTSSGRHQRRRGPRAWARRNQRAAAHQHHYIKGHISVFGRGFICFCCLEPNFLHGVSCPYCPEYWRVSSVIPQKD